MRSKINPKESLEQNLLSLRNEAQKIVKETLDECRLLGEVGNQLVAAEGNTNIMTICNAGALATVDYGTALAPMREAHRNGKKITVFRR